MLSMKMKSKMLKQNFFFNEIFGNIMKIIFL